LAPEPECVSAIGFSSGLANPAETASDSEHIELKSETATPFNHLEFFCIFLLSRLQQQSEHRSGE
jgi:hypothetical protein